MKMHQLNNGIVLIGMPGSGKSTVGAMLANALNKTFLDTDKLIESQQNEQLQQIVDEYGYSKLRALEEQLLLSIQATDSVIATGGSAIYSDRGMQHLKSGSLVVYLCIELNTMLKRIGNAASRGLAKSKRQSLVDMFAERKKYYQHYADLTIDCDSATPQKICAQITRAIYQAKSRD